MKKLFSFLLFALCFHAVKAQEAKAKQLVDKMTLEEKAQLVVGVGMHIPGLTPAAKFKAKVPGAAGQTFAYFAGFYMGYNFGKENGCCIW
jgi:hypothetical protein